MIVRPMREEDLPELMTLAREFYAEAEVMHCLEFSTDKILKMFWGIMGSPFRLGAVSVKEEKVTGSILATISSPYFSDDLIADEYAFFVGKAYRGSFSAMRLLEYYIRWAKSLGAKQIYTNLNTNLKIEKVSSLYERIGLEKIGHNFMLRV